MKNFQYMQQKYTVNSYSNRGLTFIKGEGVHLIENGGLKYLDFMTNYGINIFGHNHPHISHILSKQMANLINLHGSFNNDTRAQAAHKLVKRCGRGLAQVYFANSGAEAVEAALKFAILATGKKKFICCHQSYHGKTLGALSATGHKKYKSPFEPLLWDFHLVDFDNVYQLEEALDNETAAFIVEPIQGEGGINVPESNYLKKIKDLCESRGALLILDEIQTGMGRTGNFLASHSTGISYDLVCLGKGLAGGVPVGATLVSDQIARQIPKSLHTSTFGGNPLATAGIIATLELLTDSTLKHIKKMGDYFASGLQQLSSPLISTVKGKGLMLGIEVLDSRDDILKSLQRKQILACPAAEDVVRFLPPFILSERHVDIVLKALHGVFKDLHSQEKLPNET